MKFTINKALQLDEIFKFTAVSFHRGSQKLLIRIKESAVILLLPPQLLHLQLLDNTPRLTTKTGYRDTSEVSFFTDR